ncbi:AlbA family DNA-binding domain-containing protein [Edaphobacter aggregans]|uniref:AlbA family DNA-binding domain-containing protein n=1 Tax=Edaphobacter aggregans TaxID=570835 RepID=UPI001B8067FE|nr:ATP-binding protein [Edaphobacter aggregans]
MTINVFEISEAERNRVLAIEEGHFADLKAIQIAPGKLTKTIAALSNADGGEVYVGIDEDKKNQLKSWAGFATPEAANGHIQIFEKLFPLGDGYTYSFLKCGSSNGLVLKIEIQKSRNIKKASDDIVYVRRGAQSMPYTTADDLARLARN